MDEKISALYDQLMEEENRTHFREESYYPFALSDGTEGLFEMMNLSDGTIALLAYPGEEGVQTLVQAVYAKPELEVERAESLHSLDSMVLSKNGEELQLARYLPRRIAREMNEKEKEQFAEILSAALTLPGAVKLPKKIKQSFPAGECPNEVLSQKIRSGERNGKKWVVHIFLHMQAVFMEEGEEPFYPYGLMILENQSGLLFSTTIASVADEYDETFLSAFADAVEQEGKPRTLIAVDKRTEEYFKPLCRIFGIEFEKRSSSPALRQALESYGDYFTHGGDEGEEETENDYSYEYEDDTLEDEESWKTINESLLELVKDPQALHKLSAELLSGLLEDMASGELDNTLESTILAELDSRNL